MILDCVCVDIRISRSPLPRMLAMVLLCGYSGHGDMETLAPAPAPCEPLSCPHSCPPARPGQGRGRCSVHKYSFQPALGWCIALRRVAPQTGLYWLGFTQTKVLGKQYIKWNSVHFRAAEVGPRLSKQFGTRNCSKFCPTDLSWSTLFVDPAPGHRQWSVASAATRPRLETFAHPLISNTQILGFMLAITRGLMAICKMIMGGRKQWWQLWDTFP